MKNRPSLRRIFFRVMLWSLGAAAAAGFLAMLTASYEVVLRVAATAFATAVASGIMWRLEGLWDDAEKFVAGFLGMASTGICFLLSLLGIWMEGDEWRWWVTVAALGTTTPAAMGCLHLTSKRLTRFAGWVGLLVSCVVFVVWLFAVWLVTEPSGRWFGTVCALAGFGSLLTLCLVSVSRSSLVTWRWAGVACSALACVITLQTIWSSSSFPEFTARVVSVLTSVAIVVAHANLLLLVPLRPSQAWIRWGTIASAILTAACVDVVIIFELEGDNLMARLAGAMAIVAGCGSLALVILARYNQFSASPFAKRPVAVDPKTVQAMTIVCPRCGLRQAVTLGTAACRDCKLTIHIRVEVAEDPPVDPAAMGTEVWKRG